MVLIHTSKLTNTSVVWVERENLKFNFNRFELSDGYLKEEKGVAVHPGEENSRVDVTGFYKYIDDEGEQIEVHYTANQFGFVPEGSKIPSEITSNARDAVEAKARELKV